MKGAACYVCEETNSPTALLKEQHCSASGMKRVGIVFPLKIVHIRRQFDKTGSAKRIMAEVVILSAEKKPPKARGLA